MEIHSHTHTERKKWHHFFWEFFMLFLAVTLGFIVENWREHIVEGTRENKYIRSMIEDLKSDTSSLNDYLANQKTAMEAYDSVIFLMGQKSLTTAEQKRLYYLVRIALRYNDFPQINENTYEQMKSSGNLRLLHEQYIADSIFHYYFKLKEIGLTTSQLLLRQQSLLEIEGELFSGATFQNMVNKVTFELGEPTGDPQLITGDKKIINKCMVAIHYLYSITLYSLNAIKNQINEANHLIHFLKKEYHLE